jgi:signal transduction protein with GAF and PtsI domain
VQAERYTGIADGSRRTIPQYVEAWRKGNSLFDDYILVCNKLDKKLAQMDTKTSNKRAIITWLEAERSSHAMTVARDLGIIAMGVQADYRDLEGFHHQVQTGDIVSIKSDGRHAIAYIEKKRDSDPYSD